jgi:hypothetical protein
MKKRGRRNAQAGLLGHGYRVQIGLHATADLERGARAARGARSAHRRYALPPPRLRSPCSARQPSHTPKPSAHRRLDRNWRRASNSGRLRTVCKITINCLGVAFVEHCEQPTSVVYCLYGVALIRRLDGIFEPGRNAWICKDFFKSHIRGIVDVKAGLISPVTGCMPNRSQMYKVL